MANLTGFLDELNTSTQRWIVPGLTDGIFKNDPLLAYFKKNNLEKFPGGTQIQENIVYAALPNAGAYADGQTSVLAIAQTETGATFLPKNYWVPVAISKLQAQVFNKGPEAAFRLVDSRLQNAALTMAAVLANALYNDGITTARVLQMNGLAEILNDGTNNSWTGNTYANYGTLARNGTIGAALNSPLTNPTSNIAGPITYKLLEEGYNSIVIGDEYPNLMVTTNLGMSYIKEKFQPQWRVETQDPKIGFNGLKFNQAMLIQSQYAPGTLADGTSTTNAANLGTNYTSAGETLFYLNTKYFRMWVTDDPEFGFGFTGFKPAQDSLLVGGQYLFTGNITCQQPRLNRHFYAITG
jgi:hypothetical protein